MPIYEYRCVCGHRFENIKLSIGSGPEQQFECSECGEMAALQVSVPFMQPDDMWAGRVDPTFGYVTSKKELERKEKAAGLERADKGLAAHVERAKRHREAVQDKKREEAIASTVKEFN